MNYTIRKMYPMEYNLLDNFLYETIFQPDETNLAPKSVIEKSELQVYMKNFDDEKDDHCFCAEVQDKIVGAVCVRNIKGYGCVDDITPEFAVSLAVQTGGGNIG